MKRTIRTLETTTTTAAPTTTTTAAPTTTTTAAPTTTTTTGWVSPGGRVWKSRQEQTRMYQLGYI